ncbi:hypothetical protein [Poseidonibacter ostreae]|uniref:Uncharacterized protein n=1 Tax=Poseidonibacter ostreae TaxID=2654171 RepID=A0A6L4WTE6_9BACT|nr:hypothetical protein [Poseidonibacter ostreae]KAB7889549.1 hypothetical protein GBG19_05700 [Poseidonibacter ostreae]
MRNSKFNKHEQEAKVAKLKLTPSRNSSSISTKSASTSSTNSSIKMNKGSNGITINNRTIVVNTRYEESGRFNDKLKDKDNPQGKVASNKDIGSRAVSAINYQDRETELEAEHELEVGESLDKDMTHSYDLEKRLSKEDMKEIKDDLEKGTPALRTTVISIDQKDLSDKEELALIQKSISEQNSKYNKNVKTVITQHKDTNNRHYHVTQFGSKDDIRMSKTQTENFKIKLAVNTKEKLEEKNISHKLDKEINQLLDKQEKLLRVENTLDKHNENIVELNKKRLHEVEKATDKIKDKLNFKEEEFEQIKAYEKASGYKQFLEKQDKPDTAKIQKAEQWKDSIKSKMTPETLDKHTQLKQEVDKFNQSDEFKNINDKFIKEAKELSKDTISELKEMSKDYQGGFFKKEDKQQTKLIDKTSKQLEHRKNNLDNKKFKKVSMDSILNKSDASNVESKNDAVKDLKLDTKEIIKDSSKDKTQSYNNSRGGFLEKDKVSKTDEKEIKNLSKDISRNASKEINDSEVWNKITITQTERNKFKHDKNSEEFRDAQTKFFNLQAVARDGVDLKQVDSYIDKAVASKSMNQEDANRFRENAEAHANELTKAGILNKESDTKFTFKDAKSREILNDNYEEKLKDIADKNKVSLKDAQKEKSIKRSVNSSKDLNKVSKDIKKSKDKKKNKDLNIIQK